MHVPQWTHEDDCRISDPVNVIWEGPNVDVDAVNDHFYNLGWDRPRNAILWPEASDQFVRSSGDKTVQTDQWLLATLPIPFLKWAVRYHVRLWATEAGEIIGGAHYEKIQIFPPGHKVISFEEAERKVASQFWWPPGQWTISPSSHPLDNDMSRRRKAYNDGKATVISKVKPDDNT